MQRDHAAAAIEMLLGEAETSFELNAVVRVGRRAGFLWVCSSCRSNQYPNRETCCGNPRPDDSWED